MIPSPDDDLLRRYAVPAPRYTSYPTVPTWSPNFKGDDLSGALRNASVRRDDPLSLYVHLPFCRSLCWYCGCNVVISKSEGAADQYLNHVARELELLAGELLDRRALTQVHLGGGTPTFLNEAQLERLWRDITSLFDVRPGAEVAVEIHPTVTRASQLETLRACGFNRLSMGLQDFDPRVQVLTNRLQTYEQTRSLLEVARQLGYSGTNFDLIYGLPGQTEASWAKTLEQILTLRPDRLAVYRFAYLPEQLKHQRRMPAELIPKDRVPLELFRAAAQAFVDAGYVRIGLDHFALPTDELARAALNGTLSRNFQGYTVQSAPEVIAAGATGISDIGGAWAQSVRPLPRYYEAIARGQHPTERGLWLSEDDQKRRRIITELMCNLRVELEPGFEEELRALAPLRDDGLVQVNGSSVEVTELGRYFIRNIAMVFDAYVRTTGAAGFSKAV